MTSLQFISTDMYFIDAPVSTTPLKFAIRDSRNYSGEHTLVEQNCSEQFRDAPTIYTSNKYARKYKSSSVKLESVG